MPDYKSVMISAKQPNKKKKRKKENPFLAYSMAGTDECPNESLDKRNCRKNDIFPKLCISPFQNYKDSNDESQGCRKSTGIVG